MYLCPFYPKIDKFGYFKAFNFLYAYLICIVDSGIVYSSKASMSYLTQVIKDSIWIFGFKKLGNIRVFKTARSKMLRAFSDDLK